MTLRPFYNLVQLGLDEYEDNELVLNIVHDLTGPRLLLIEVSENISKVVRQGRKYLDKYFHSSWINTYGVSENLRSKRGPDLTQFFEQQNCTCRHSKKQKDLRTCYEKVGFKHFFERYIELKSLDKKELEYRYCYNQGCGSTRVSRMG
ncbi:hypothetical protein GLOIN_2v1884495 [Rhizophagus irregularis DAOM 181602=DAOM 197198]|nr:hypothetical protein GLOIN_2v1884495 [Rhizophagus irregularis DAOM 181602=DAOM 197198]